MFDKSWWLNQDLWSQSELQTLCLGYLPGTPDIPWDDKMYIKSNQIKDAISKAVLAGNLPCICPPDMQDAAHRMYDASRLFLPGIAIKWASQKFPDFVLRDGKPTAMNLSKHEQSLGTRERRTLLNIIHGLSLFLGSRNISNAEAIGWLEGNGYKDYNGISKTTMEQKFSEASKSFSVQ